MAAGNNSRSRAWVFTLNNPESNEIEWPATVKYAAWQREVGEEGTPHLQGYVEFKNQARLTQVRAILSRAHWEIRRGTQAQARDYAMKEDTRDDGPWEFGEFVEAAPGKRQDLEEAAAIVKDFGLKRLAEEMPVAYVKYHRGFQALTRILYEPPRDEGFVPRAWQQGVLDLLAVAPNDRTIIWVNDPIGNKGKSRLARHLVQEHHAIILSGRVESMAYAYDRNPVVIFDVARAQQENMEHLYSFAENLKNGVVFSSKYESEMKIGDPPHVIFFANRTWDRGNWSVDRVHEIVLE